MKFTTLARVCTRTPIIRRGSLNPSPLARSSRLPPASGSEPCRRTITTREMPTSAATTHPVWGDGAVMAWFIGMGVIFPLLIVFFKHAGPKMFRPKPFLAAFEFVSAVPLAFCALYGVKVWCSGELDGLITPHDRLYAYNTGGETILKCNLAFQLWDFIVSLFHAKLRAPEFLAHHAMAALLSYWGIALPYCHYYAVFYFGLSELSSVPLALVDLCKFFPELARLVPGLDIAAKTLFAVLFIAVRDVAWAFVTVSVWRDSVVSYTAGDAPFKHVLVAVLVINVFFTALQLVWTKKLIEGIVRTIQGVDPHAHDTQVKKKV